MTAKKLPVDPRDAFAPTQYYSIASVCDVLQVSRGLINEALIHGDLKAIKAGTRIRIRGKELNAWLTPYR
ncbi:helix-turn-helix domain-containing protein [Actinomyces sp. HMSC065F12]|uniref:helix-turn-helix domain-containing protein n=1 Tax=Actinomyces sp. HMSC065F12 TaxID=1739479 RepID=UPI0008A4A1D9|nr:helix-turn-helix domain-containing protein [Actinomyces sp. HMSC065F12]OFP72993.1 hypothetical protein HMPREF2975_08380 [Actinomyces sp. HMSC065F12]